MRPIRRFLVFAALCVVFGVGSGVVGDPPTSPASEVPEVTISILATDALAIGVQGAPAAEGRLLFDILWYDHFEGTYTFESLYLPFELDLCGSYVLQAGLEPLSLLPDYVFRVRAEVQDGTGQWITAPGFVSTKDSSQVVPVYASPVGGFLAPGDIGRLLPETYSYVPKYFSDGVAIAGAVLFSAGPEGALGGN